MSKLEDLQHHDASKKVTGEARATTTRHYQVIYVIVCVTVDRGRIVLGELGTEAADKAVVGRSCDVLAAGRPRFLKIRPPNQFRVVELRWRPRKWRLDEATGESAGL